MTALKSDVSTMKALVGGMGPDWVLDEVPVPVPAKGEVLARVWAAGVNRADLLMLEGAYNPEATWHTTTFVAGLELAGEVAVVSEDVSGVEVGDRVMAATPFAFAQFAPVDHRHLIPVPESTSWTEPELLLLTAAVGSKARSLCAVWRRTGWLANAAWSHSSMYQHPRWSIRLTSMSPLTP
jgi:NADPH:quinone reductase-like Zn-dependent oxidoreductase